MPGLWIRHRRLEIQVSRSWRHERIRDRDRKPRGGERLGARASSAGGSGLERVADTQGYSHRASQNCRSLDVVACRKNGPRCGRGLDVGDRSSGGAGNCPGLDVSASSESEPNDLAADRGEARGGVVGGSDVYGLRTVSDLRYIRWRQEERAERHCSPRTCTTLGGGSGRQRSERFSESRQLSGGATVRGRDYL